jgi:hypothetical protein
LGIRQVRWVRRPCHTTFIGSTEASHTVSYHPRSLLLS